MATYIVLAHFTDQGIRGVEEIHPNVPPLLRVRQRKRA
jgi:uncharacterized protein with GYD domain